MFDGAFGDAGAEVVIEEFMEGEEASFFVLCDGETVLPIGTAQDYKRVGEGDSGPNTGGMGAYSPAPVLSDEIAERALEEIIRPCMAEMAKRGMPYQGVLYAGLMIKDGQPRLVEYNVRFGDPECQVLMMRLGAQAFDLMQATAVQALLRGDNSEDDYYAAKLLASRLLTETRRSEQQIRLQQFSTPLPFAALTVRAAAIRKGETVLEPSAGTGAPAAFAARAGATLLLNEIDPFRQRLLRAVFGGEVTGHDGEHIDDLLQTPVLPDVV